LSVAWFFLPWRNAPGRSSAVHRVASEPQNELGALTFASPLQLRFTQQPDRGIWDRDQAEGPGTGARLRVLAQGPDRRTWRLSAHRYFPYLASSSCLGLYCLTLIALIRAIAIESRALRSESHASHSCCSCHHRSTRTWWMPPGCSLRTNETRGQRRLVVRSSLTPIDIQLCASLPSQMCHIARERPSQRHTPIGFSRYHHAFGISLLALR
jgi:hypothetical protein